MNCKRCNLVSEQPGIVFNINSDNTLTLDEGIRCARCGFGPIDQRWVSYGIVIRNDKIVSDLSLNQILKFLEKFTGEFEILTTLELRYKYSNLKSLILYHFNNNYNLYPTDEMASYLIILSDKSSFIDSFIHFLEKHQLNNFHFL